MDDLSTGSGSERARLPATTIILAAFSTACVTGGLFAIGARTQGIDRAGMLFAIGLMGAGAHLLALIIWYLVDGKRRLRRLEASQQAALYSDPGI